MKIVHHIESFTRSKRPIALTIGMFDGVHLGHQTIINRLVEREGESVVLTFSSHPAQVLYQKEISLLTTLSHRLTLFEQKGIDTVIMIPFTKSFSNQSASTFLTYLKQYVPFTHLILGHDATIGKGRKGDRAELFSLANSSDFFMKYIEPIQADGMLISSSEIRKKIQSGDLAATQHLIGRPYSIYGRVTKGFGKGQSIGFQTANLPVEGLCLPPLGVYAVKVRMQKQMHLGVANLGHAPTLHTNRPLCLEVHLLDCQKEFYDEEIEVIFLKYLRPEKHFATFENLKEQIKKDISSAKHLFCYTSSITGPRG